MLEKIVLIYFARLLSVEEICGQNIGTGTNADEVIMNNPTTNSLALNVVGPNTISANPAQANGNIEPMGFPNIMANGPAILEPIAASLASEGNAEDFMRSARGALISGFGNPGHATVGFVGSPVPAGSYTLEIPGKADGVILGPGIGDTIGRLTQPNREFITDRPIPEIMRVPMPPGAIISGLADATVSANGINTINIDHNIVNGPLTNPVLGEFSQVVIPNGLINPNGIAATVNSLQNSAFIPGVPTDPKASTFASPVFPNGLTPHGMATPTKTFPATFPGHNLAVSKQILASLTGIDPSSLGAKTRFKVTSASPIAPTGLKIQAENLLMEGKLKVSGNLPFLGSVTVDGVLPDGGKGTVIYESGNGNIGIVNEGFAPMVVGPMTTGLSLNPIVPNGSSNVATNRLGLRNNLF
ncbi:hypothetical protein O3G_MSEX009254 [Manduca sexta]|uniref:Uncharacterized protein n=2 Tax=Manduca sexta TaxID=7130 RepID=A0A921ZCL6_MANSE|nr:hypothetical protein O3G_MSEX009254 [Manduca sexta]